MAQDTKLPPMDPQVYENWVNLVRERTGTRIPKERRSFLETNVAIRMREIGCCDYQEYFELINSRSSGSVEWAVLVDRLTVHETRFFRHMSSLDLFTNELVERRNQAQSLGPLNFWSVGCATGEEAYTLGILIDEVFEDITPKPYTAITATDISLPSLASARDGIYAESKIRNVDESRRQKYFARVSDNRYQIIERLRQRVCFATLNLMDVESSPFPPMDIIFCQNVLIYFDRSQRNVILDHLATFLKQDGLLILGVGEATDWQNDGFSRVNFEDTLAFRRVSR